MSERSEAASEIRSLLQSAKDALNTDLASVLPKALKAATLAQQQNQQELYAAAMLYAGMAAYDLTDLNGAEKYLIQAMSHFSHKHASEEQLEAIIVMGQIYRDQGKYSYAYGMFTHALHLARENNNIRFEADALNGMAGVYAYQGDYQKAIEALEAALPLREGMDAPVKIASLLSNLGTCYTHLGQYFEALSYLMKAHQLLATTKSDPRTEGVCLLSIGSLYRELGDYNEALRYFRDAISISNQNNSLINTAVATVSIGEVLKLKGHTIEALDYLKQALSLSRKIGFQSGVVAASNALANLYAWQGNTKLALRTYKEALELARQTNHKEGELDALIGIGKLYLVQRKANEGYDCLLQALQLAEESGRKKAMAQCHECLTECCEMLGNARAALEHFKTFHKIDQELKSEEGERRSRYLKMRFDLERTEQRAEMYRVQNETNQRAREVAEALVRERTRELEQSQVEIVTRLAIAAESRDDVTGAHTWRVGRNAAMLAQELGLPREEVELLRLAARLHDVGKIGIPDSILMKHGILSAEEYEHMKTHTIIGGRILSGGKSRLLQMAQEIAVSHHERWDGRGYPFGLIGEQIPLSGRIVAVADVFDALTHKRPYKQAWSLKHALDELARHSGAHFDPRVVEAALTVFNNLKIVTEDVPEL